MEIPDGARIWRYIDLGKLVNLLADQAVFFPCLADLIKDDPYEAAFPKAQLELVSKALQKHLDELAAIRPNIPAASLGTFDSGIKKAIADIKDAPLTVASGFGISCWHENPVESAAMWKLYSDSGKGIAIESTVGQLKSALEGTQGLIFDRVRYIDFENDPVEKGHRHYAGFQKRTSFAHEREFRVTLLLKEKGIGQSVPCDLQKLITAIHISPHAPHYVTRAVKSLCAGSIQALKKPVLVSRMLDGPDYAFQLKIPE